MDNLLLTDEEIRKAIKKADREGQRYGDDGEPIPSKEVAISQHNKILQELKDLVENIHLGARFLSTTNMRQALERLIEALERLIERMEKE